MYQGTGYWLRRSVGYDGITSGMICLPMGTEKYNTNTMHHLMVSYVIK
jgi:hypothetical protein